MVFGLNSLELSTLFEIKLQLSIIVAFNSEYIAPPYFNALLSLNRESSIIRSEYDVYSAPPLTLASLFVKLLFSMYKAPLRCRIAPPNSDLQLMKLESEISISPEIHSSHICKYCSSVLFA